MSQTGIIKDASGSITSGTTAQAGLAAATGRKFLCIQNPTTASEALWFSFVGDAVIDGASVGSFSLAPGGAMSFEGDFVPSNAISVNATTTGHEYLINWA